MFDSLFLSHSLPTNRLASHAALPNFHGKLGEKMDFWRDYAILSIKPRMHLSRHFLFSLPCRLPFFFFFFLHCSVEKNNLSLQRIYIRQVS